MILCLRSISFLFGFSSISFEIEQKIYHSVSAFGSSIGTLMRSSIGAAMVVKEVVVVV